MNRSTEANGVATIDPTQPRIEDCPPPEIAEEDRARAKKNQKPKSDNTTTSFTCDVRLNEMINDCARMAGWRKSKVIEAACLIFCMAPDSWQLEAMKRAASFKLDKDKTVQVDDLLVAVEEDGQD